MAILAAVLFIVTGSAGYYCSAAIRQGELINLPDAWRSESFLNLMLVASVGLLVAGLITAFLPRVGRALALSAAGSLAFLLFIALLGCVRVMTGPQSPGEFDWGPALGIIVVPLVLAVAALATSRMLSSADK